MTNLNTLVGLACLVCAGSFLFTISLGWVLKQFFSKGKQPFLFSRLFLRLAANNNNNIEEQEVNEDDFVANDTPRNGEYYAKIARRIQEAGVPPLAAGANQEGRVQNI